MGRRKLNAIDAFGLNMADADLLLCLANALKNERKRRMRKELRQRVGEVLKLPKGDWPALDCVESNDFFVVLKPDASIDRDDLADVRPLLRQAIVAACAAVETYVADRVMELVGPALRSNDLPERLMAVPMTVGKWAEIEGQYKRKGWGVRQVVEDHVRVEASAEPMKIGILFSTAGVPKVWKAVNSRASQRLDIALDEIVDRRNRIAHEGDRAGRGRATLSAEDVANDLKLLRSVVEHLEAVT